MSGGVEFAVAHGWSGGVRSAPSLSRRFSQRDCGSRSRRGTDYS